jgi:hypothetical protein
MRRGARTLERPVQSVRKELGATAVTEMLKGASSALNLIATDRTRTKAVIRALIASTVFRSGRAIFTHPRDSAAPE